MTLQSYDLDDGMNAVDEAARPGPWSPGAAAAVAHSALATVASMQPATSAQVLADTARPLEERCAAAWNIDPALRAEFGSLSTLVAYETAKASGQAKIYRGRGTVQRFTAADFTKA